MKYGSLPHHVSSKCAIKQALTVLSELERFLSVSSNSRERKNRQKLLRNLKVHVFEPDSECNILGHYVCHKPYTV